MRKITATEWIGGCVIAAVGLLLVLGSTLPSAGISGEATPVSVPAAPAVGQCLTAASVVIDCSRPHRWEVTASWAAVDGHRSIEATEDTCRNRGASYGHLRDVSRLAGWTLRISSITAVRQAPANARAGLLGWAVCTIQPAWVDSRTGSIGAVRRPDQAPELFGLCLYNTPLAGGGVDCGEIHDQQLLGSTVIVSEDAAAAGKAATASCYQLAALVIGVSDPTFHGQLSIHVDIEPDSATSASGRFSGKCSVISIAGNMLNGTVVGLGDGPLPLTK